jgi:glucose-1-phosphate thymidylyltransferase
MIVIILAGGYAKRLWPLTENMAKPLLPVRGKPIINYIMDKIAKLENIEKIVISTNKRFEHQLRNWLSQQEYEKVRICAEPTRREEEKKGAIKAISELVVKNKANEYMIVAGDNFFSSNLKNFARYCQKKKASTIAVYDVKDLSLAKEYASIEIDEKRRIVNIKEKPRNPKSTLVGTCIYFFPQDSLRKIHEYLAEGNPSDSPGYFIEWLHKRENVYGYVLRGHWTDIGTLDAYMEVNRSKKVR